nr:hypothetical protein [Tanacetum cinerariifolium]
MAPLVYTDTHNMIAFLSKSDASAGLDQTVDFLNAQVIHYALMVNPTIYVSYIKQLWATTSLKKVNDVVKLQALIDNKKVVITEDIIRQDLRLDDADGVECLPNEEIFAELARIVLINNKVDDLSSHTTKYTSPALTQKDEVDEVPAAPTPPLPTHKPSSPIHEPITTPPQAQPAPPSSPPQVQPTITSASDMTLLNTLIETCTTLSHTIAVLEQDKVAQALEIFKLKRRVKRLEKKRRLKHSGLKRRMHPNRGKIADIDADEDITLVDMETEVDLDADLQGRIERKDDVNATDKEVNAVEPIVFNVEEVTMTMAQTLIKMKAKKARILDEQMAKRLHDEEIEQAAAREKQENIN